MGGRAVVLAIALVAIPMMGCVTGGASGSRGTSTVLTAEELLETGETDLYLAIQRLRPRWLTPRGQNTGVGSTVVTLFIDGAPRGNVGQMRGLLVTTIEDVTYLSASEATFRFGTLAGSGGTVSVRTRLSS